MSTGAGTPPARSTDGTPRPVRVLTVIARMNVGGPAPIVTTLLAGLDPARFTQRLLVGSLEEGESDWFALREPALRDDPRIVRIPSLGRAVAPLADWRAGRAIRREIAAFRPDIVHTHTAKAGLLGRRAARRAHVPAIVHTFHGHVLHGYFPRPVTSAYAAAERRLARHTDLLFAVGARVRDELLAAGIGTPERFRLLPPGVAAPDAPEPPEARRRLGIAPEVPVVAFVGRLTGVKRPDRFLAMAALVAREVPDCVFLVAGGGSASETASLTARVGDVDVRFLGWTGDVGAVYRAADVVVVTSDNEGMPVTLVEAGMLGRACVTTDVGSAGEVVLDGRTGRVVAPDAGALAAAVVGLLGDSDLRARLGAAARVHTHASFGQGPLVEATVRAYASLVSPTEGNPSA